MRKENSIVIIAYVLTDTERMRWSNLGLVCGTQIDVSDSNDKEHDAGAVRGKEGENKEETE
jgi:hypothetical protein